MINQVDVDGKGSIGFDEFLSLMASKVKENEADQELRDAFRVFDKDQDGFISPNEVTNKLTESHLCLAFCARHA
ncbi:unnamed protein product [Linum grandiflorum]